MQTPFYFLYSQNIYKREIIILVTIATIVKNITYFHFS